MAGTLLIEALGITVSLDLSGVDADLAEAVRAAWRDAAVDSGEPAVAVAVAGLVAEASSSAQVLSDLSQRVTLEAITARKGELWMLHAAGLALPDGRVLVLVGPSGRGKTTAARALGQHLGYVSDETVGIDRAGGVHPHRKPLSVIEGAEYKAQLAPSQFGVVPLPAVPLRLGAVVLLDRDADGPEAPVVEAVDLGDAIDELVTQTSFLAVMPSPLAWIAEALQRSGGMRRVRYREAATLPQIVDQLVAPGAVDAWHPVLQVAGDPEAGAYSRAGLLDAVLLEQPTRLVVAQLDDQRESTVRVLGGIAPMLWEHADGASFDELVEAAVERFGVPEGQDPAVLVRDALTALVDAGVLRRQASPR